MKSMKTLSSIFKKSVLILSIVSLVSVSAFAAKKDSDSEKKKKDGDYSFFNRIWELGVKVDVNVANNYFEVLDFFHPTIELDFNDMSQAASIGALKGLSFDLKSNVHVFSNVLARNFSFGFDIGVDPTVNLLISRDLIDFIANGNCLDEEQKFSVGVGVQTFLDVDIPVKFKVGDLLTLNVSPSYYIPLVYMPYTNVGATIKMESSGKVSIKGETTATVYSVMPVAQLISGGFNFSKEDILPMLSKGGFDISVGGTFQLLPTIKLGANATSIPIYPSKANAQVSYKVGLNYETDSMASDLIKKTGSSGSGEGSGSGGEGSGSGEQAASGFDWKSMFTFEQVEVANVTPVNAFRPMKFGFWAEWQDFGNDLLVLTPFIQMRFLDATSKWKGGFGFDYALTAATDLKFFKASLTSSYIDQIFKQQLFFAFNLRILELDISIGSQGTTFGKSFCGNGVGVGVGVILGF